jgi:hypothetical protein
MNLDRTMRYIAFGWAMVSTLLAATFTAGYAMTDPGGWRGVALTLAWLTPLMLASVAAARWPRRAVRPLAVAVAAVVLLELAAVLPGIGWADVENQVGPVRAVAVFTLAAPLAVLGLRRTVAAGRLSTVLGLATVALSLPPAPGSAPMRVVGLCTAVTGLLYLLSSRRHGPPRSATRVAGQQRPNRGQGAAIRPGAD